MKITKRQLRQIIKEQLEATSLQHWPDFEKLGQDIGATKREESRILDLMNDIVLALTELGDYRHLTQAEKIMTSMEGSYGV
tara:strand:+ start:588 stop:830 length:243 start_codon:yes stop_codon:yes gene_type:complete